jgi:DNA polymerase-3 subunit epsilon
VVDLETTGLDPYFEEIIEISAIKFENGEMVDVFTELVKPYNPIDPYITDLTGITNDMVADCRNISEVLPDFISFVGSSVILGHNVNFDINFIYDNWYEISGKIFDNDFIDTMRLAYRILPNIENRRLETIANHYNINPVSSHRALADCETTNKCYLAMKSDAIAKYGTVENFNAAVFRKKVSARDISTTKTEFDEFNPLFGKVCCFTGALESMPRRDAMQLVADLGGICSDGVTKKTNYLILGNTDYCANVKGNKTTKTLKAEKAKLDGQDIEIISENVFLDMVSQS